MSRSPESGVSYLTYIPNVLWPSDLKHVPPDPDLLEKVSELMTPSEILEISDFDKPETISPDRYKTFDDLVKDREKIRTLRLLPLKTDEEYVRYHQQPKELLLERVRGYLGSSAIALAPNIFPCLLPADLRQSLVWVKDHQVDDVAVREFIAKSMTVFDLTPDDLILFERSTKTRSKIVKGTFPDFRHIHFWSRIRNPEGG